MLCSLDGRNLIEYQMSIQTTSNSRDVLHEYEVGHIVCERHHIVYIAFGVYCHIAIDVSMKIFCVQK